MTDQTWQTVYYFLNVGILVFAIVLQLYLLGAKLRCRIRTMDRPALIILGFYNLSFLIKAISVIIRVNNDSIEEHWIDFITYVAILLIWAMLYKFVFDMRIVRIKIEGDDPDETARSVANTTRTKRVVIVVLVVESAIGLVL